MSNRTYVCLDCRTAKRAEAAYGMATDYRCSSCSKSLVELGWRRRIPQKDDDKGWIDLRRYVSRTEGPWTSHRTKAGMAKLAKMDRHIAAVEAKKITAITEKNLKNLKFRRRTTAKQHNLP